jgi:hypothetical protein
MQAPARYCVAPAGYCGLPAGYASAGRLLQTYWTMPGAVVKIFSVLGKILLLPWNVSACTLI